MRDPELDREAQDYEWIAPERERQHNKMTSASAVIVAYTLIVVVAALLGMGLSFVYGGK